MTTDSNRELRFIDLFCGIGGFRIAATNACRDMETRAKCVFSSDINSFCREAYAANFGERPTGDITRIPATDIPDHDLLLAGFPCQPFSVIGKRQGFADTRGTLFFDIARILDTKRPAFFLLENVRQLVSHHGGETLGRIMECLADLGYQADYRVLNALNFGLPQKRERVFIAGFREPPPRPFTWPKGNVPMTPLRDILEKNVAEKHYVSDHIRVRRLAKRQPTAELTIWHENKSGNVSAHPFSCALRAGASYNYLLVNGERRLTPRETLRLQGFPDSFKITQSDNQTRKQTGNSLPVNVAQAVIKQILVAAENTGF